MSDLLQLLQKIRERPGIMLGRPSMRILYAFLSGYTYARKDTGCDDFQFLSGFGLYVKERFRMGGMHGWARIIEFQSPNEEYEMKLFWELLDEYLAKRASKNKSKSKKKAPRDQAKKDVA